MFVMQPVMLFHSVYVCMHMNVCGIGLQNANTSNADHRSSAMCIDFCGIAEIQLQCDISHASTFEPFRFESWHHNCVASRLYGFVNGTYRTCESVYSISGYYERHVPGVGYPVHMPYDVRKTLRHVVKIPLNSNAQCTYQCESANKVGGRFCIFGPEPAGG